MIFYIFHAAKQSRSFGRNVINNNSINKSVYSGTCNKKLPTTGQPEMGDCLLMADVLSDIVKYTSDKRPLILKDHVRGGLSVQFSMWM